jgi:hypothetical protein
VSPVYKGGFGASQIEAVAPDGEGVVFYSPGAFAGAPSGFAGLDSLAYFARRNPTGWSTLPLMPPDVLTPYVVDRDVSSTLEATVALGKPGASFEQTIQQGSEEEFLSHPTDLADTNTNWEIVGGVLETRAKDTITLYYEGASSNLCHLLFESAGIHKTGSGALVDLAEGASNQKYELDVGCDGKATSLQVVALDNHTKIISPLCVVDIGLESYDIDNRSAYNAISSDGSEIFFTTCIKNVLATHQLFVRIGGERTLEVSKPLLPECTEVPCSGALERPNADFVGASEDGSRVFFTTSAPLAGDGDTSNNLYMAEIGCPAVEPECELANRIVTRLANISHDPNGSEPAREEGVLRIAPDGSRAYFVSSGNLLNSTETQALEAEKRAVPHAGAKNLYVYNEGSNGVPGHVVFVGDLCSGPESSGLSADPRCPSMRGVDTGLWTTDSAEAQTAGKDGRYLVFASYAQLARDDTDTAKDIYRYDAVTGALVRVSGGEGGYDANGNNNGFDATIRASHRGGHVLLQHEMNNRTISENGSRIIFTTAERLSPSASNHLINLYEWHQPTTTDANSVSLVSTGSSDTPVEDAVIAPGGSDIFFVTTQGLVAEDGDGAPDVYDARLGGGFPTSPAIEEPCEGDACQGALTDPLPVLVPGSVVMVAGDNYPSDKASPKLSKAKKRKKAKKAARGRRVRARRSDHARKQSHTIRRGGRR